MKTLREMMDLIESAQTADLTEGSAVYYHVVDHNKKSVKAFMDSPSAVKFLNARRQKDPTAYKWKIITKKNAVIALVFIYNSFFIMISSEF